MNDEGAFLLGNLFKAKLKDHLETSLGNGAFTYEAAQSADNGDFTVWKLALYAVQASGDPNAGAESGSEIYVITARKDSKAASAVIGLLGGKTPGPPSH